MTGNVVRFRKRRMPGQPPRPGQPRGRRPKRARVRVSPWLVVGVGALCLGGISFLLDQQAGREGTDATSAGRPVSVVRWVDGDSGTIDGRAFRLHGVDAPEKDPRRAKCTAEIARSGKAFEAAVALTADQSVVVDKSHGPDAYDRELVDLSVGGADIADRLVAQGHLKRWNFEAGQRKPDWCR